MKILKSILSLLILLSLVSCRETSDRKPNATGTSYATLIFLIPYFYKDLPSEIAYSIKYDLQLNSIVITTSLEFSLSDLDFKI